MLVNDGPPRATDDDTHSNGNGPHDDDVGRRARDDGCSPGGNDRSRLSGLLYGKNHLVADAGLTQGDERIRTEIEAPAPISHGLDNNVVADAALGHLDQIVVRQREGFGLPGLFSLMRVGNRCVALFIGILGVADQSAAQSAGQCSNGCTRPGFTSLVTDHGPCHCAQTGSDQGPILSMVHVLTAGSRQYQSANNGK